MSQLGGSPQKIKRESTNAICEYQGGRTSAGSAGWPLRRLLVAAELALALVLLSGAGLMVKSFWRMNARPPGFDPEHILALRVPFSGAQHRATQI